jgi:transposase
MFIDDLTYIKNGKTYRRILLRNSYRVNGIVRHDTVANLSQCSDKEIEELKQALKYGKKVPQIDSGTAFELKQGSSVGAVWVLHQLAKQIGITQVLGNSQHAKLVLWLIYARLLNQGSRLSAARVINFHAGCDILDLDAFTEEDLYKAMDFAGEEQPRIENELFLKKYTNKVPSFYLYDVTSSYLEGEQNELGDYGYNRDGKKNKKQIVIGLMTDADGWPITTEVFQGNTNDTKTVKNQIEKVANRFGVKEVTFVGDRGMLKRAQIESLKDKDFHYITAITKPEINTLMKNGIIQFSFFEENVFEVESEGVRYVLRRNPVRANEIENSRESKFESLKELVEKENLYLSQHKKASPESSRKKILGKASKLKIDQWVFIEHKERKFSITEDEEKKAKEAFLDGCYVIKTDRTDLSAQEVHDRYKDLAEVEIAFRSMKTTFLEMRGIFVRKATRTKTHVFIVMLSYMLAYQLRRLWKDVELTVEEGIEELKSICSMEVHTPQLSYQKIPEPRPMGKLLLEKAGVSLPDSLPCKGIVIVTRKKLVSERKELDAKDLF